MPVYPSTDLAAAKAFTDDPDTADGDRSGFDVTAYNVELQDGRLNPPQVYYAVTHTDTGVGVGSFASLAQVDEAIAEYRDFLAKAGDGAPISATSPLAQAQDDAYRTTQGDDAEQPSAPVEPRTEVEAGEPAPALSKRQSLRL